MSAETKVGTETAGSKIGEKIVMRLYADYGYGIKTLCDFGSISIVKNE